MLAKIPGSPRPGTPEIESGMVTLMMGCLNRLHAIAKPDGLPPTIELGALDRRTEEQLSVHAGEMDPGNWTVR